MSLEQDLVERSVQREQRVLVWHINNMILWSRNYFSSIIAIENDPEWYRLVDTHVKLYRMNKVRLHLFTDEHQYVSAPSILKNYYDAVFINGPHQERCAVSVIPYLADGAFVFLREDIPALRQYYSYDESANGLHRATLR